MVPRPASRCTNCRLELSDLKERLSLVNQGDVNWVKNKGLSFPPVRCTNNSVGVDTLSARHFWSRGFHTTVLFLLRCPPKVSKETDWCWYRTVTEAVIPLRTVSSARFLNPGVRLSAATIRPSSVTMRIPAFSESDGGGTRPDEAVEPSQPMFADDCTTSTSAITTE